MINEALQKVFNWPVGFQLNEGFQIKCSGTEGTDANGMPITTDRHLICILDDHLPGAQSHAWKNKEFDDSLWIVDSAQSGIDWSNPVCQTCGKPLSP